MIVLATIAAALLTAIIEVSILPWTPLLGALSLVSMGVAALVVVGRMRAASLFAAVSSGALAYFGGAPTFSRALIMVVAVLALVPVRDLLRSGHTVTAVIAVSIVLGIAARGTFSLTMPVVIVVVIATLGNAIAAGAWLAIRRSPKIYLLR